MQTLIIAAISPLPSGSHVCVVPHVPPSHHREFILSEPECVEL